MENMLMGVWRGFLTIDKENINANIPYIQEEK